MIPFPSIEAFHRLRLPEEGTSFAPKIKLHGTNAGVFAWAGDNNIVTPQSRNRVLTPEDDNYGFAAFAQENREFFLDVAKEIGPHTLFGEWAGPGIQQGVAVSQIPERTLFVFAAHLGMADAGVGAWWHFPQNLPEHPRIKVLPYETPFERVDPYNPGAFLERVNALVGSCDETDPYILREYGISGPGEGYVFYTPTGQMFKAKGEKHRVNKDSVAARARVMAPESVREFAEAFSTVPRFEQALHELGALKGDTSRIGEFLQWVCRDVAKEGAAEMEAGGIPWKQASPIVVRHARTWFLAP